ncbi:MAG: hypothetical protein ABFD50_01100 [Smithella sp.]
MNMRSPSPESTFSKTTEKSGMTNLSADNENLSESPSEEFLKTIEELFGVTGMGNFIQEHILPSGFKITHHFSFATGLCSQQEMYRYRSKFGEPPRWLKFCHPYHRSKLCEIALETNTCLPRSTNDLSAYILENKNNQKLLEEYRNKPNINGTVTLDKALPVLVKNEELCNILQGKFGSSKADLMISMMKNGSFTGNIGDELYDFLNDNIYNESKNVWSGIILKCDRIELDDPERDDTYDYPVDICCYYGIYYVWALDYDETGFFLDFDSAKSFVFTEWDNVVDA